MKARSALAAACEMGPTGLVCRYFFRPSRVRLAPKRLPKEILTPVQQPRQSVYFAQTLPIRASYEWSMNRDELPREPFDTFSPSGQAQARRGAKGQSGSPNCSAG